MRPIEARMLIRRTRPIVATQAARNYTQSTQTQRRSKALVVMAESDPRFAQDFHESTCIFATNNDVSRTRARRFAAEKHQRLCYATTPSQPQLRCWQQSAIWTKTRCPGYNATIVKPDLPLCAGMPVAAADHLDRERGMRHGCPGRVCGWTRDSPNAELSKQREVRFWTALPSAVCVQFKTRRKWRVKSVAGNNCILPVSPVQRLAFGLASEIAEAPHCARTSRPLLTQRKA